MYFKPEFEATNIDVEIQSQNARVKQSKQKEQAGEAVDQQDVGNRAGNILVPEAVDAGRRGSCAGCSRSRSRLHRGGREGGGGRGLDGRR